MTVGGRGVQWRREKKREREVKKEGLRLSLFVARPLDDPFAPSQNTVWATLPVSFASHRLPSRACLTKSTASKRARARAHSLFCQPPSASNSQSFHVDARPAQPYLSTMARRLLGVAAAVLAAEGIRAASVDVSVRAEWPTSPSSLLIEAR